MNPKDMSKESLIVFHARAAAAEAMENNSVEGRVAGMNGRNSAGADLLRRLDEADALRKENEELRNSLLGSIKQMRSITTSTTLWNAVEFAYKERAYCVDGVPYTAWSDMHRNINDEIELAEKLLVSVTSEKAKESEASHAN